MYANYQKGLSDTLDNDRESFALFALGEYLDFSTCKLTFIHCIAGSFMTRTFYLHWNENKTLMGRSGHLNTLQQTAQSTKIFKEDDKDKMS